MKRGIVVVACMLAGVLGVAEPAAAWRGHRHHGRHSHFGLYLGAPLFWGPSYYRPWYPDYYYPPRTVIIEREPSVYIQRQDVPPPQAQAQATQLWYYCPNPAGYYPHVPNCTQAWVPVDPRSVPPPPVAPQ
ncbi:MAG: hypothetical protein AB7O21_15850 [Gammaproteobacteria bacterium]